MRNHTYRVRPVRHPAMSGGVHFEVYNRTTGESAGVYATYPEASGEASLRNRFRLRQVPVAPAW